MNNPPAFPHTVELRGVDQRGILPHGGMTLRDYFAAKAMAIYMADQALIDMYVHLGKDVNQEVADAAYKMADAMLEAREK